MFATLSGLLFCLHALGSETATPSVDASHILDRLKQSHPRLLASNEDFGRIKAKQAAGDPQTQAWTASLHQQAIDLLGTEPSKYEIPDGLRLLDTSRRVLSRVYTLALMYRLENDSRYAQRAWLELEAAANFKDWNPRHFLDTAEMTHAFAIGYDWLHDAWTPEQRLILRVAMVEKGFKPALDLYRAKKGFPRFRHNWNQVCNGGIGMGALALASEEPLCGEILSDAIQSLPLAMAEFGPDGAWKEGPGYWNYATSYNVTFLAALETALGSDFGLSRIKGFSETGLFPIYLTGPLGRTFNYADGGDRSIHAPQLFWLARKFQQPVLPWFEMQVRPPAPLDLLWSAWLPGQNDTKRHGLQMRILDPKAAGLPLDKYFRGAEVATLRSEWENPKALFVGFKAGDNKANHSHLDLGDFVFDALGARWAVDLGADDYNLPDYFGNKRWDYYRLRAEGQNTLVLNADAGPDQDPAAKGNIIRFQSRPERAFAIADLTEAYHKHARKVWRGIAMEDRQRILLQDEVEAGKPADLWWFMHTPASIKIEQDGRSALLQQVGAQLRAQILSPPGASFQVLDAQPLPSSPHPEKQARNQSIRKLAVHMSNIRDTRISVLFIPLASGGATTNAPAQLQIRSLTAW
jgi:hypothetical protein